MFVSEELDERHDLSSFESGKPEMDDWLRHSAHQAKALRTGRTFVWHQGDNVVVAYYTLSGHQILKTEVPAKVGRGGPDRIPAVLLARLALDLHLHDQQLGKELLLEALTKAVEGSRSVAARVVVVDALDDEASGFYRHFGFFSVPDDPNRLVQKMSDIEAALGI